MLRLQPKTHRAVRDDDHAEPAERPGRACPLRYRYGASALATAPPRTAQTLFVIGGLYGNRAALDAIDALADAEPEPPTRCFNGDFNWFDIDDEAFVDVNRRVLAHDAILGNVEAEFDAPDDTAGCGCAYPDQVGADIVARSNLIHAQLKTTARRHPGLVAQIAMLPMYARYRVGACRVGVVHGDADALAGWRFDVDALDDPAQQDWRRRAFTAAGVDLFASTHTCLPALRAAALDGGHTGWVANNGAAGMPNFTGELSGLITRVATTPAPQPVLCEVAVAGAHVALLPVRYERARWRREFLRQWPPGSPAWTSYFERIEAGPRFTPAQAWPAAAGPGS